MSRWFRHYAGMMRDEKLVRVAVKSKQSVERVVWVWGAILESAAEINDGGRYELDTGEAAYFLRCDESNLVDIIAGLVSLGRLADGLVARWSDRQFDSDSAKERQRRYRERQKAGDHLQRREGDVGEKQSDVTPPSRDGEVTLQETDTETYQKEEATASSKKSATNSEFEVWYRQYPHKVQRGAAERAFSKARSLASVEELIAGVHRYIASKPADRQWQNPATWLNGKGWLDAPAPVACATAPPKTMTVGQQAREELRQLGMMPNAPRYENRHHDESDDIPGFAGTSIARRIAGATSGQ